MDQATIAGSESQSIKQLLATIHHQRIVEQGLSTGHPIDVDALGWRL